MDGRKSPGGVKYRAAYGWVTVVSNLDVFLEKVKKNYIADFFGYVNFGKNVQKGGGGHLQSKKIQI